MFFGSHERSRARRRGVVLILILGMLALMALIGVTFATFAGQNLVNSKNFAQSVNFPKSDQVMDYALAQLINDTNNPVSALRGHSLLRDVFGNDSLMTGSASAFRCYLDRLPDGSTMVLNSAGQAIAAPGKPFDMATLYTTGLFRYGTNIPVHTLSPLLYGVDFTRWILRIPAGYNSVAASYEVIEDDQSGTYHYLTLSPIDANDLTGSPGKTGLPITRIYNNPTLPYLHGDPNNTHTPQKGVVYSSQPPPNVNSPSNITPGYPNQTSLPNSATPVPFTLDARSMRAFNGPGLSQHNLAGQDPTSTPPDSPYNGAGQPHNSAAYANFRTNGNLLRYPFTRPPFTVPDNPTPDSTLAVPAFGDPDAIGMDEDYDACDLENWFLALQSADGEVMIPSFHRPGILTAADWTNVLNSGNTNALNAAAIMSVSKILRPRQTDNSPYFPADPVPDNQGKIRYDVDNDGDGVTDSVWLDLGYPSQRDPRGRTFKPLFAFMVIGLNGRLPLNTAGNIQSRDFQTTTVNGSPAPFNHEYYPENFMDGPTWSHASHLGYSVNEINPLFALQNAPNLIYGTSSSPASYSQVDSAGVGTDHPVLGGVHLNAGNGPGVGVDVLQIRNLLAGTIPQDSLTNPTPGLNTDENFVHVNNQKWYVPNSIFDPGDIQANSIGKTVGRSNAPVPGRWGEPNGIPTQLQVLPFQRTTPTSGVKIASPVYDNPVRAGRSYTFLYGSASQAGTTNTSADGMDDDFDSDDFLPGTFPNPIAGVASAAEGFNNNAPTTPYWAGDFYDASSSLQLPVERIRRFVTPIDPAGVGRLVAWTDRPLTKYDYGQGNDRWGRVGFFRYFRPAGVPETVTYDTATVFGLPGPVNDALDRARYNEPILTDPAVPNTSNNRLHGFQSYLTPIFGIAAGAGFSYTPSPAQTKEQEGIAVSAAMPYDILNGNLAFITYPTPPSPSVFSTSSPSTMTHHVNTGPGPFLGPYTSSPPNGANDPKPALHPFDGNASASNPSHVSTINGYPNFPMVHDPSTNDKTGLDDKTGIYLPSASLNKDEADEMNLYVTNLYDAPYGPSDLEWLYRKQDVDGAGLDSRLARLAPISFLNDKDGTTRRRLFSTDSWEPINFAFAPDNPSAGYQWNSRFAFNPARGIASNGTLAGINYNANPTGSSFPTIQNQNMVSAIANPVAFGNSGAYSKGIPTFLPNAGGFPITPSTTYTPTIGTNNQLPPIVTPSVAHRDRKVNLNFPLPVSNDPAEPVRQKWIREVYQLFKAILPPQATDTPEELAELSQYVVNIVDFRDPDCSATRFVNTDLMVVPATATDPSRVVFTNHVTPNVRNHFPYDPAIYDEQPPAPAPRDPAWTGALPGSLGDFLVQHGMEYSPLAINEVLAYTYNAKINGASTPFNRFAIELINTLTDDAAGNYSDLGTPELDGWDFIITPDNSATTATPPVAWTVTGRPDPTTGEVPPADLATSIASTTPTLQAIISSAATPPTNGFALGVNKISALRRTGPTGPHAYYVLGSPIVAGVNETPTIINDGNLPPTFRPPTPTAGQARWYWLYLRRPANPFDQRPYAQREMVVVDSIRFSYNVGTGTGTTAGGVDTATPGPEIPFSAARLQPYRGGHFVPRLPSGTVDPSPPTAWGYSEQTNPGTTAVTAKYGNSTGPIETIYHTMGTVNNPADPYWSYFPFHDRDFMSPAELLVVPGCPPGLFTKQFIESNDFSAPASTSTNLLDGLITTLPTGSNLATAFPAPTAGNPEIPPTFPYLVENFFYGPASVAPYANATKVYPSKVGGFTGDGWHKLLEFVEVPSSAAGAIGGVPDGANFDWYRQDRKPGLINLNLVIDEEVFFGLIDDPRLNNSLATLPAGTNSALPRVVTQIDQNGYPAYSAMNAASVYGAHYMSSLTNGRGYTYFDPQGNEIFGMKAAFSDFLKLRAGGSGYLFAFGSGAVGSGPAFTPNGAPAAPATAMLTPVAAERPFQSLSFPDINATVMRPATLPPSKITNPIATFYPDDTSTTNVPQYYYGDDVGGSFADHTGAAIATPATFVGDPGLRNPYLDYKAVNPRLIPVIPPRRLFAVPDSANVNTTAPKNVSGSADFTNMPPAPANYINPVNQPITHEQLSNTANFAGTFNSYQSANLFAPSTTIVAPGDTTNTLVGVNNYLGTINLAGTTSDHRQHPYYRTEILQKVMNLTTVRTHQFAVWITVGFFEVLQSGSAALGVPDVLGGELGLLAGKNIRYRSFFLLDRTRAVGFNPSHPIDFRDVVTYRRRIE